MAEAVSHIEPPSPVEVVEGHCRHAVPEDRPHFVRLWRALLEELRELGSYRLPDEHNLYLCWDYFDAYTTGRLDGVVAFWCPGQGADPAGAMMAGAEHDTALWHIDRDGERWGHLHGVYVEPAYRGARAGLQVELFGEQRLIERGFHRVVTTVQNANPLGQANWRHWDGAREVEVLETVIVARLGTRGGK